MTALSLLLAMALSAPGDIYRCVDADGQTRYGDRPCPGRGARLSAESGYADDPRVLDRWLEGLQPAPRPEAQSSDRARPAQRPVPARSAPALPPRPSGTALFRQCSARFFACASGDGGEMDACVATIPSCSTARSNACCPDAYVDRYQRLRKAGAPRQSAVRDALLGR